MTDVHTGVPSRGGHGHPTVNASLIHQASVTLTDAEFKALPTDEFVVVPATETLNYSGVPTRLPIPISAMGVLDARGGAYTGLGADGGVNFAYGDRDTDVSQTTKLSVTARVRMFPFVIGLTTVSAVLLDDNVLDNSLALFLGNSGVNLGGGHVDNSFGLGLLFKVWDFTLKKFLTTDESGWDENTRTFTA